jgi:DnaJ family protein A protein 5
MWADEYDSRDAENRWVRRQMEKENEDRRKKEKREYVQTVKQLGNKRGRV